MRKAATASRFYKHTLAALMPHNITAINTEQTHFYKRLGVATATASALTPMINRKALLFKNKFTPENFS
jgi:hypothetical protein